MKTEDFPRRNFHTMMAVIKNESLVPIVPGKHLLNLKFCVF